MPADSGLAFVVRSTPSSDALAIDHAGRGIGIILSGSESDGAEGLKALKAAGGLTLAQDPREAQQDGVPRQAIQVAKPDHVLQVADMPAALSRYVTHDYLEPDRTTAAPGDPGKLCEPALSALVDLLRDVAGQDLRSYKAGTLQRRIQRRMALNGIGGWEDHLAMVRGKPAEADALTPDLLINVTRFFRDPEVFAGLTREIAGLLSARGGDQPARVWVAGCSTGEEAYTLAMLFEEQIEATGEQTPLQIFATDIDLLSMAREGLRASLRDVLQRAFRGKRRVSTPGVHFERDGRSASVTIEAQRLADDGEPLVLVTFIDEAAAAAAARGAAAKTGDHGELAQLRRQLLETRRELNCTILDLRDANGALRSKHEEAMSLNEEFLSTHEELESLKEEPQSLNEELTTVNNQLRQTLEQQQQTSTDLENLLNSSPVATIMLDAKLCIKVFNPRMAALYSILHSDVGRPLTDLAPKFTDPDVAADAEAAGESGTASEREIRAASGA